VRPALAAGLPTQPFMEVDSDEDRDPRYRIRRHGIVETIGLVSWLPTRLAKLIWPRQILINREVPPR
jgi:hypothetical protein